VQDVLCEEETVNEEYKEEGFEHIDEQSNEKEGFSVVFQSFLNADIVMRTSLRLVLEEKILIVKV
jgi:hypothetical protein